MHLVKDKRMKIWAVEQFKFHLEFFFSLSFFVNLGQIEQFFLVKHHFPGLCVCTQLFSP